MIEGDIPDGWKADVGPETVNFIKMQYLEQKPFMEWSHGCFEIEGQRTFAVAETVAILRSFNHWWW